MSDMTFRDFDAAIAEERGAGLSTFKLGGQTFTVIPLPFEALATFAVLQGQAVADPAALVKIVEFLAECVLEDADKVRAALRCRPPTRYWRCGRLRPHRRRLSSRRRRFLRPAECAGGLQCGLRPDAPQP
jgi:hypothetical protein